MTLLPNLDLFEFKGSSYNKKLDRERLSCQLDEIYSLMKNGAWYTVTDIAKSLHLKNESSVSAQIRNLRKSPFNFTIERRNRNHVRGLSEYRLIKKEN